jgi:GNAT superfamily N-acetyltransferase
VEIREIDPAEETLTHRFWEIGKAADEVGRPWSTYWPWETARAAFTHVGTAMRKTLVAAFDGDEMVGCAEISFPLLDNTHSACPEIFVDPAHQRRGIGEALLRNAEDIVRGTGRHVLISEVATPDAAEESAGVRFARKHGFKTGIVDNIKVVDLVETAPLWDDVLAAAAPHLDGYDLRSWLDHCPEDLVDGYCRLMESFNTEAPLGELDLEPERWDKDRLREREERFRRSGRHEVCTVALDPDGSVAGFTEVMVSDHRPQLGLQGGTLVARAHRGHRLGITMKVLNHQAVRRAYPDCVHLLTGNADVNAHMNAVNDRLGYRTVERLAEMQKVLD